MRKALLIVVLLLAITTPTLAQTCTLYVGWQDTSADEDGFRIERGTCTGVDPSTCSGFAEVHVTAANVTTWQNDGLTAGVIYGYRVRAFIASASPPESGYTNVGTREACFGTRIRIRRTPVE